MDLTKLVRALVAGDLLAARQMVADAYRTDTQWELIPEPRELGETELAIAAGIVELLAWRKGLPAPAWTVNIAASTELVILDPGLEQMPRSFERAKAQAPDPLRRRNLLALPDFLDVA